jgi:hypothetical protein
VERALERHPAVIEALVLGVPHSDLGEELAAVVVPRAALSVDELRDWLARELPRASLPGLWLLADTLPRSALGKVQRGSVRDALAAQPLGPSVPRGRPAAAARWLGTLSFGGAAPRSRAAPTSVLPVDAPPSTTSPILSDLTLGLSAQRSWR